MLFIEFDLAGAEWVICAYLANDTNMLGVVASGKSPHVVTGSLISRVSEELVLAEHKLVGSETDIRKIAKLREQLPELYRGTPFIPQSMSIRQAGKKSNHALDYGMQYRRFALENEIPEPEAQKIVEAYSNKAYPGLKDFWRDIKNELRASRTLTNCFGRKVRLLTEWGNDLFQAGYSFKPQSTVADCVNKAMKAAYTDESRAFEKAHLAAQVHDSLNFAHGSTDPATLVAFVVAMKDYMTPELCYSGKTFRLGCDAKIGQSWGAMQSLPSEPNAMLKAFSDALADEPPSMQPPSRLLSQSLAG